MSYLYRQHLTAVSRRLLFNQPLRTVHTTTSEIKKEDTASTKTEETKTAKPEIVGESSAKIYQMVSNKSFDQVLGRMKAKWTELEVKLPVWQVKLADKMQSFQDYLSSKYKK